MQSGISADALYVTLESIWAVVALVTVLQALHDGFQSAGRTDFIIQTFDVWNRYRNILTFLVKLPFLLFLQQGRLQSHTGLETGRRQIGKKWVSLFSWRLVGGWADPICCLNTCQQTVTKQQWNCDKCEANQTRVITRFSHLLDSNLSDIFSRCTSGISLTILFVWFSSYWRECLQTDWHLPCKLHVTVVNLIKRNHKDVLRQCSLATSVGC